MSEPAGTRPALVHVCGRYLPLSETFTYDLLRSIPAFDHHVVASAIENLEHFPLPQVVVPQPEERAWALAREIDARAVLCHFGPQATMGMPIALALDRPVATIFHGYDVSRLLLDRRWVERYRAMAALGMQALCISHAGRQRLIEIGWPAAQIDVIHLGVDTAQFAFQPPAERWRSAGPRRILMVARLVPKKGVDVALDAMRRLEARGVNVELRIIGDGPERKRLETLMGEYRLSRVTLLGALEHRRTREEFQHADLYIQPSVTAESGDQEGIPVSLMEAQASGLPVVSTRHSGIPELVVDGETGLLTGEGDSEALARAIEQLVNDRSLAQRIAVAGRTHVEQEFDRDRQAPRFAAYMEALVNDPSRRPSAYRARRPLTRRRALILGSVPTGLLARKLLLLAHRYPDVRWDVLTTGDGVAALRQLPLVGALWIHGRPALSIDAFDPGLLAAMREEQYELVVVPFDDETGDSARDAIRVAAEVRAHKPVGLTMRDREQPLTFTRTRLEDDESALAIRGL